MFYINTSLAIIGLTCIILIVFLRQKIHFIVVIDVIVFNQIEKSVTLKEYFYLFLLFSLTFLSIYFLQDSSYLHNLI